MTMNRTSRLAHFPISWFAIIMGLSGLTIAWEKSEAIFRHGISIAPYLLALTALFFVILLIGYGLKLARYRAAVIKELSHPVKLSFFPTISVSLILLSIATLHSAHALSQVLWIAGTALHLLFTLYVLAVWINHEHFQIQHINPAWFIPVVGNILVPIAGVAHGYTEISWFFFSVGLVFWVVLMTIIFYRVIFRQPLPGKLVPTFFILIAPPAVGFISYMKLTGALDAPARILYYFGLFLTLLLSTQVLRFARLRFFLSWWAYSFPLAAITIACMVMYQNLGGPFFRLLSLALLTVLTTVILLLVWRTLVAVRRHEICVEED
ncbi:MAG: SLAC1 anion channel family protein [Gammaproteobacteria bacterium]